MADKKISALTQVSDTDIGADDLLHIVDNPGGTPVNKKMTKSTFGRPPRPKSTSNILTRGPPRKKST